MTGLWSTVAGIAGRINGWRPARWHSTGGLRVLVIAPHPDDEIACGGTLLLHQHAGDAVHVAYVTDGRGSRAGGLGPDEMAQRRRQETLTVAPALGLAATHWLGLREWEWEESALVTLLQELLRAISPHVLYAPSRVDFHPEHIRAARCLAAALAGAPALPVRVYQVQVPLTPVLVNLVAPVESVAAELVEAMRCYETQRGNIERSLRTKRYGASLYGLGGLAEEFWAMSAEDYRRTHRDAPGPAERAFRGVRARPFFDPLSYLQGLGARRRLRKLALAV